MRKIGDIRTNVANIIYAKSAEVRVWSSIVNWPVTLWRWARYIVMFAAIGCLAVDVPVYAVVTRTGLVISLGTSIQNEQLIEVFQYILLMKAFCAFTAYIYAFIFGRGRPETAYKRDAFCPITD